MSTPPHWLSKKKQAMYKNNIAANLNATVLRESYINTFLLAVNACVNWNTC